MSSKVNVMNVVDGISVIDSEYYSKDFAAIYLLKQKNKVIIIETGTNYSVPYVKEALSQIGLSFSDVSYVIPTHVHLDHAGGAGLLMMQCQNAALVVHPRGARHLIDPSKLVAGAKAVYGENKFKEYYGEIFPIDANRVIQADDNFILDFDGRELRFIDTPGHARHHFCIWDKATKSMFTGDTFGISYRDLDHQDELYILPSTSPVQFDPEALIQSINRIMEFKPERVCLTHFSAIKPTKKATNKLIESIHFVSNLAIKYADKNDSESIIYTKMMDYFLEGLNEIGFQNNDYAKDRLSLDVLINTQGLIYWQKNS
ncbi:MBL fold metallo-hydrolase [Candidatus Pseudothioglobus singularis]|jgi:glyoxylase-like metal-dependent hydrolase (beta-lactamase superfamily II)|nr:MBL fold metallo-hydrolase [Candidatus Pseudothioglobus singularis]|tara:strand:- start:280 stop:1224 length:945 start_codon:yes stop_codon:yes gene_type:complete